MTELMRASARYVIEHDDGFYTGREVREARKYLDETEPMPSGWGGLLPGLPDEEDERPEWVY